MKTINKAVLAYSGGLDTSIILKWLQDHYGCEVVTFTAEIGQGEEVELSSLVHREPSNSTSMMGASGCSSTTTADARLEDQVI